MSLIFIIEYQFDSAARFGHSLLGYFLLRLYIILLCMRLLPFKAATQAQCEAFYMIIDIVDWPLTDAIFLIRNQLT